MAVTDCSTASRRSLRRGPAIGLLVEARYLDQAQPAGLARALAARGVDVRTVVAEDFGADLSGGRWAGGLDLLVARGRSTALIGLLRSAEHLGVPVLQSASAVQGVVDKAGMAAALSSAGVPTPTTWLGNPERLALVPNLRFPLVLKPVTGDNARGLVVVRSRTELAAMTFAEPVALAQEFHRGDGHDVKVYVAGHAAWAVRRPSPIADDGTPRSTADPGRPIPMTPALRSLAVRCSELFGLSLLGLDCVEGPKGPLVVEVNDYPNFRGIAGGADQVLADVVLSRVEDSAPCLEVAR